MKKSLIAFAVAAALPAAAFAQTNVQLYGIGDANITSSNSAANGGNGSDISMNDGTQSGSRVGVQGSEDLGGGLSAEFRFELGLDVDDGDQEAKLFGRQARIGLKGGFGRVRFGRQYTPIFYSSIGHDLSGFGWYNNHFGIAGSAGRLDNMVEYQNKFGAVNLIAAWAPGERAGAVDPDDVFGIGVTYRPGGAWRVGFGYHDEGPQTVMHVGGKVQLGALALGLNFGLADRDNNTERTDIDLSAGLKVGASGNVVLNILNKEDDAAGTNDSMEIGLAYGHALSKRTNWYVALGIDDIDNQDDTQLISVGMRHKF